MYTNESCLDLSYALNVRSTGARSKQSIVLCIVLYCVGCLEGFRLCTVLRLGAKIGVVKSDVCPNRIRDASWLGVPICSLCYCAEPILLWGWSNKMGRAWASLGYKLRITLPVLFSTSWLRLFFPLGLDRKPLSTDFNGAPYKFRLIDWFWCMLKMMEVAALWSFKMKHEQYL